MCPGSVSPDPTNAYDTSGLTRVSPWVRFTQSLFVKPSGCSVCGTFCYSWRAPGMGWLLVADDVHLFCSLPGFSVHIDLHDISSAGKEFREPSFNEGWCCCCREKTVKWLYKKNPNKPTPRQIICRGILTLFAGEVVFKRLFVIIVKETHSSVKTEF